MERPHFTRKDIPRLVFGGVADYALFSNAPQFVQQWYKRADQLQAPEKEPQPLTLHTFGLHTIAQIIETPEQMDATFKDAQLLGVKSLTAIQPSELFLKRAKALGITIIARVNLYENNYNDNRGPLEEVLANYKAADMTPIIQVGNEIDIEPMTNPTERVKELVTIENYMEVHFMPAFERVMKADGIMITPPLATPDMKNKAALHKNLSDYWKIANIIEGKTTKEQREKHLRLGIHSYIFYPNTDAFTYIREVKTVFGYVFGQDLPIYVTEAGISPNVYAFSKDQIATQMKAILLAPIPKDLKIEFWNAWLHGGTKIRNLTKEFIEENKWWLERDDLMAFRDSYTQVNPVFTATQELVKWYGNTEQKLRQKMQQELPRRGIIFLDKVRQKASNIISLTDWKEKKDSQPGERVASKSAKPNVRTLNRRELFFGRRTPPEEKIAS